MADEFVMTDRGFALQPVNSNEDGLPAHLGISAERAEEIETLVNALCEECVHACDILPRLMEHDFTHAEWTLVMFGVGYTFGWCNAPCFEVVSPSAVSPTEGAVEARSAFKH